jgi:hypothetical protein
VSALPTICHPSAAPNSIRPPNGLVSRTGPRPPGILHSHGPVSGTRPRPTTGKPRDAAAGPTGMWPISPHTPPHTPAAPGNRPRRWPISRPRGRHGRAGRPAAGLTTRPEAHTPGPAGGALPARPGRGREDRPGGSARRPDMAGGPPHQAPPAPGDPSPAPSYPPDSGPLGRAESESGEPARRASWGVVAPAGGLPAEPPWAGGAIAGARTRRRDPRLRGAGTAAGPPGTTPASASTASAPAAPSPAPHRSRDVPSRGKGSGADQRREGPAWGP